MPNKKVIILIIFGALAVISLIYGLTASPRGRKAAVTSGLRYAQRVLPATTETVGIRCRPVRTKFASWRRSPFIHMENAEDVSYLVLNGILSSRNNPKASINNIIVGRGDKIGSHTVVAIKKDRVILNDGVKNFELKLER